MQYIDFLIPSLLTLTKLTFDLYVHSPSSPCASKCDHVRRKKDWEKLSIGLFRALHLVRSVQIVDYSNIILEFFFCGGKWPESFIAKGHKPKHKFLASGKHRTGLSTHNGTDSTGVSPGDDNLPRLLKVVFLHHTQVWWQYWIVLFCVTKFLPYNF